MIVIESYICAAMCDVQEISAGKAGVLLISPERLANDEFISDRLKPIAERVALLVVDEAHCISCWGHDFRPDYRRVRDLPHLLPQGRQTLTKLKYACCA